MFGSLGFTELILILFIVLVIFGAGKLPQLGEGIGKAIKGFKKSVHEADAIEAEAQAAQQKRLLLRSKRFRSPRCKHRLPWSRRPRRFIQRHAANQPE